MLRLVGWLAVLALGVGLAWALSGLPGTVALRLAGYDVTMASGVAALGAGLLALLLLAALWLLLAVLRWPGRIAAWRARRRRARGEAAVSAALTALAAGEARAAQGAAGRAVDLLGATPQTLLLAAEGARLAGRDGEAATHYRALRARPDGAFLGLRGLFRLALAREDFAEAAALAREAGALRPGAPWLRAERLALAARAGDWATAQGLADGSERQAFATAAALAAPDADKALGLAKRAWKQDRGFAPAALAYAGMLRRAGREKAALGVLGEAWAAGPHPAVAEAALAGIADPMARLAAAGRLAAGAAGHAESHLLLGRANLEAGLLGEARRHAEAARAGGIAQRRLFLLRADIAAAEQDAAGRQEALLAAAAAEADPAWHCGACGTAHDAWHAACPACHAPAGLAWGARPGLPALIRRSD